MGFDKNNKPNYTYATKKSSLKMEVDLKVAQPFWSYLPITFDVTHGGIGGLYKHKCLYQNIHPILALAFRYDSYTARAVIAGGLFLAKPKIKSITIDSPDLRREKHE